MPTSPRSARRPIRQLRRRIVWLLVIYFVAGTASQKLVPGVDEIFPFFGWSLFSRVPNEDRAYSIVIYEQAGQKLPEPVSFLRAPEELVHGNRFIARKVVQHLGEAVEEGDRAAAAEHRRLLARNYLASGVVYEVVAERYDPLVKWRTGKVTGRRALARFVSPPDTPPPPAPEGPREDARGEPPEDSPEGPPGGSQPPAPDLEGSRP